MVFNRGLTAFDRVSCLYLHQLTTFLFVILDYLFDSIEPSEYLSLFKLEILIYLVNLPEVTLSRVTCIYLATIQKKLLLTMKFRFYLLLRLFLSENELYQ